MSMSCGGVLAEQRRLAREGAAVERRPAAEQRAGRDGLGADVGGRGGLSERFRERRAGELDQPHARDRREALPWCCPRRSGVEGFDGSGVADGLGDVAVLEEAVCSAWPSRRSTRWRRGRRLGRDRRRLDGGARVACPPAPALAAPGAAAAAREAPAREASGAGPMAAPTATPTREHRRRQHRARAP